MTPPFLPSFHPSIQGFASVQSHSCQSRPPSSLAKDGPQRHPEAHLPWTLTSPASHNAPPAWAGEWGRRQSLGSGGRAQRLRWTFRPCSTLGATRVPPLWPEPYSKERPLPALWSSRDGSRTVPCRAGVSSFFQAFRILLRPHPFLVPGCSPGRVVCTGK